MIAQATAARRFVASFVELSLSPGKNHRTWNLQHSRLAPHAAAPLSEPATRCTWATTDIARPVAVRDGLSGRDSTPAFSALARPPPRAHEVRTQHEQPRAASPSGARAAAAVPDVERTCGHSHWARLTEGHRGDLVFQRHTVCVKSVPASPVPPQPVSSPFRERSKQARRLINEPA